jgi:hypothetical protein
MHNATRLLSLSTLYQCRKINCAYSYGIGGRDRCRRALLLLYANEVTFLRTYYQSSIPIMLLSPVVILASYCVDC